MIGVRAFKLCIVYCVDLNIEGISKITSDFIKKKIFPQNFVLQYSLWF